MRGGPREASLLTPGGEARVVVHGAAGTSRATLVLGHSAGGGIGAPDLAALAEALPPRGVTVVLVEQPWRVAGRRVASPPPTLDRDWLAVLDEAAGTGLMPHGPLVLGGRSAGARVAARTAGPLGAAGVLALAFPLVPPGSGRSRLQELRGAQEAGVPVLVVQGERDPFGGPAHFPRDVEVRAVPLADHSFAVIRPGSRRSALAQVVAHSSDWLDGIVPRG